MPDNSILEKIEEIIKKFQKEQAEQKNDLLRSVLETEPGKRLLQGADNFFTGTQALNSLGRAIPDLFLRGVQAPASAVKDRFFSEPGQDEGLRGASDFFSPFGPLPTLPAGFPVSGRRDIPFAPGPTATPTPSSLGFNPPSGPSDSSHLLFAAGAGRNEKEGKIKDLKRDMDIEEARMEIMERMNKRRAGPRTPGGARAE